MKAETPSDFPPPSSNPESLEGICDFLPAPAEGGEARGRLDDRITEHLDGIGLMVVVISPDQTVSFINRKGCEILGSPRDEIVGRNWFDTFLPEWSREAMKAGFMKMMNGDAESLDYFENPVVTREGAEKMIAWRNSVLRRPSGCIVGTMSSGEDITERKRAEEALGQYRHYLEDLVQKRTADFIASEEKYRTLVENVPLVVYRIGPKGEILFINRFVQVAFGYAPEEVYVRSGLWNEWVFEGDRARVQNEREASLRDGREFFAEYRIRHKDGHVVYVSDHSIPLHGGTGELRSVDGIIMDVTHRVELEEKLVQAKGIKTITEVSSRLAHEIRNPLASAGGYARRLLSSMNPAAPEREKVQIIVNEVARLEGILGMILKSLQPLELRLERVDLKVLMQDVLSAIRPAVHDRGVQVDLELPPGIPPISADRLKMGLALQTLLRKAVSQMPEAEVLNISISRDQKNCRIAVRYPVAEMLPGDVEHFFYPFITPRTGYDTWDLPSAQILIHKHGGLIEVKSREAKKFFVDISIPLAPPLNSSN